MPLKKSELYSSLWTSCDELRGGIVVHEMLHLLERHHNDRFISLMDRHLPHWRLHQQELNPAPLTHDTWIY
jgi:predicted metal-dependent hydrolase